MFENISKRDFHGIVGYPGMQFQEYDDSVSPKKIIYYGVNWDERRGSRTYMDLYTNLAKKNLIVKMDDHIIDVIKQHGIVLILHSDSHFNHNLPSLREFEAAAASSIIISDELPFVKEAFGDNALYIKVKNKSAKEIEDQVVAHYEWIKANPEKVKEMTKNAHEIYKNKFTLEKMLKDVAHMHESVLRDEIVDDSALSSKLKRARHIKKVDSVVLPAANASY